jgi:hypothetical protein
LLFRKQRERASEQRGVSRFCHRVESEANLPVSVEAGSADVLPLGRVLTPKSGQIDQGMQSDGVLTSAKSSLLIGIYSAFAEFNGEGMTISLSPLGRKTRREASMSGYSYIQWKVAMARMQDANMATTEITEQGELTRP